MHYEIVPHPEHVWRVKTHAYRYKLSRAARDVFRIHWHPVGNSDFTTPHVHLPMENPTLDRDQMLAQHLPTGRLTVEEAVHWTISCGVKPARDDYEKVLAESHAAHVEHRTWSAAPPLGK
ncbi:MAG: hypothetical protein JWQ86_930 [Mycobacterium sp.]|nr:hypothetical protein [Mycobacterium sp.]